MKKQKKINMKNDSQLVLPFPFPDSQCTVVQPSMYIEDPLFRPSGYLTHPFARRKKQ